MGSCALVLSCARGRFYRDAPAPAAKVVRPSGPRPAGVAKAAAASRGGPRPGAGARHGGGDDGDEDWEGYFVLDFGF